MSDSFEGFDESGVKGRMVEWLKKMVRRRHRG